MTDKSGKITKEMEVFISAMIEKRTAIDAYCLAYPAKAQSQSRKTLSVSAHKLKNRDDIKKRISSGESLVAIAKDRTKWTKEKRLELIEDIVTSAFAANDYKVCLQGIELAGKMCGDMTTKIEMEVSAVNYQFNILQSLAHTIEGQIIEAEPKQLE